MAAAFLQRALERRGAEGHVCSAGLLDGGVLPAAGAVKAMERRGLSLEGHRSRRVTAQMLGAADLVVTMEARHVQNAVALYPECWPRSFPSTDLVRRAERVGARRPDYDMPRWIADLHAGRRPTDVVGTAGRDDVPDPMGGPARRFEAVADELESLMERFAGLAFDGAAPADRTVVGRRLAEAPPSSSRQWTWRRGAGPRRARTS